VQITVNEKFQPLYTTKKRYNLVYGGRGSGKSFSVAQFFIIMALCKQFFRGVLMREVLGDIRLSQFQEIKDLITDYGLQDAFQIKENTMEFICHKTGNKIISKGFKKSAGNQTAKVKSIKDPTHIWIEEGDEISEDDFTKADTSIRTTKTDHVAIIITFNPEDEDHWINKKFFKSNREDTLIIHSTYRDNIENLQEAFIEALLRLKEEDPYYYDVFVEGLWGSKKVLNPFASQYKKSKHETDRAVFDPHKQLLISIDFNLNPFGVIFAHMWRDQYGEHVHIFEEASIEKGSIPAMVDLVKLKFGPQLPSCIITGDAMGKRGNITERDNASNYEQLRRGLGLSPGQLWLPANPHHKNSRTDVNYVLYHFPDFKINPVTCPNTCRDMRTVQADAFGEIIKKDRNDLTQRADHLDCVRYLINTFLRKWIDAHMKIKK
jgi:phage terminase large subunit